MQQIHKAKTGTDMWLGLIMFSIVLSGGETNRKKQEETGPPIDTNCTVNRSKGKRRDLPARTRDFSSIAEGRRAIADKSGRGGKPQI